MSLTLKLHAGHFAVCRLPAGSPLPHWFVPGALSHVSWTDEELSVVCAEDQAPGQVQCERGWRSLMLCGPFAFTQTGILAQVLEPLAQARVGIFAVSTFDTDYVMVKQAQLALAVQVLLDAGHRVQA